MLDVMIRSIARGPLRTLRVAYPYAYGTARAYSAHPRPLKELWKERLAKLDQLFLVGVSRFHEITGYAEIEKMKHELILLEHKLNAARQTVRHAREHYNERLSKRTSSQSEMNELLMRKQSWLPSDLERFTELYKDDHQIQQGVLQAKQQYDDAEAQLEDLQLQVGKLIGARYREEQLWSDKIRQASTWGTWVLMGFNVLLFILVQLILEPWKRRRLVKSFEDRVENILNDRGQRIIEITPQPTTPNNTMAEATDNNETTSTVIECNLQWSNLIDRIVGAKNNQFGQAVEVRPVELGALTLAGAVLLAGVTASISALVK